MRAQRPEITARTIESYLHNLYRAQPDFVYSVSRDFARSCPTPILVMPDDAPSHPYQTSMDVVALAPHADAAEVAHMRREADRILELIINSSLALGRTSGRLDLAEDDAGRQVVRKIQPINDLSLYLSGVSADERLIGPLRQLMGEEPVVMEEKLNYKEPLPEPVAGVTASRADSHFPVHSDWAHYKAQNWRPTIQGRRWW